MIITAIRQAIEDGRKQARKIGTPHCLKTIKRHEPGAQVRRIDLIRDRRSPNFKTVRGVDSQGRAVGCLGELIVIDLSPYTSLLRVWAVSRADGRGCDVDLLRCDIHEPDSIDRLEQVLGECGIPTAIPG